MEICMAENVRHRKKIRLQEYDYSLPGGYFVTVCTFDKQDIFGNVLDEKMMLSREGIIAQECWKKIPEHFKYVLLDEFIVMPDHIHGVIIITDDKTVGTRHTVSLRGYKKFGHPECGSLSTIVGSYKSAVTKQIHELHHEQQTPVWQSRYYDRVIRNQKELDNIRKYIYYNPAQWGKEKEC
jgi:putative transposase